MAAPHLSGLIALLWSKDPTLRRGIDKTFQAVTDTAVGMVDGQCDGYAIERLGVPNSVWGYGRIDAHQATLWSSYGILLSPSNQRKIGMPGTEETYDLKIYNRTAASVAVNLQLGTHQWQAGLSTSSATVPAGGDASFTVTHTIPELPAVEEENLVITATWPGGSTHAEVSTKSLWTYPCSCPDITQSLPLAEDFNGDTFPPEGWTVVVNNGYGWESNSTTWRNNYTGGSGTCAIADSDYHDAMDTELRTPVMDLSSVTSATSCSLNQISMDYGYQDHGYVDISTG